MPELKWKIVQHPRSTAPGKHVILVAYKRISFGIGRGMGEVIAASPLYDLRDFNLDGDVSFLEGLYASGLYDPYELNSLLLPAAEADFKMVAGNAVRDTKFVQDAAMGLLRTAYKATARAAITLTVEKILGPGIEKTLAVSALKNLETAGNAAMFVIQMGMETVIMESIAKTHLRFR